MDTIIQLAPDQIRPSPSNPRKHLGDLSDLANSLTAVGLQQPVVVRPVPDASTLDDITHELVFGHRRHAAAQLAGLETITAIVREYSDDEVLEVQIVENSQREDVHPLDEADGFQVLVSRGRSISEVADRIGRPPAFVAKRLQLLELTEKARQAFDDDQLTIGAAMALARLPATLQDQALEELLDSVREASWTIDWQAVDDADRPTSPVSAKAANHLIRGRYLLRLADAPWGMADDTILDGKPACATCPARTGNQAHLWDDQAPDLCLDSACYRAKLDAAFVRRRDDDGIRTLTPEEAKVAVQRYAYSDKWVRLDAKEHVRTGDDGRWEPRPVSEIVYGRTVERVLAQDPETGAHVELVSRNDVNAIVRQLSGATDDAGGSGSNFDAEAHQRKIREEAKVRGIEARLALEAAIEAMERGWEDHIVLVLELAIANSWSDSQKDTLGRRGIKPAGHDYEKALLDHARELFASDVTNGEGKTFALALEVLLRRHAPQTYSEGSDHWKAAMKALGVDLRKIKRDAKAAAKPKKKAPAKKPRAKKAAAEEA